jgi:hypothetical protein
MCENTISAGFQFMLGKFLFDLTIFGAVVVAFAAFWGFVIWSTRR